MAAAKPMPISTGRARGTYRSGNEQTSFMVVSGGLNILTLASVLRASLMTKPTNPLLYRQRLLIYVRKCTGDLLDG